MGLFFEDPLARVPDASVRALPRPERLSYSGQIEKLLAWIFNHLAASEALARMGILTGRLIVRRKRDRPDREAFAP
jgi:hypothetical protein